MRDSRPEIDQHLKELKGPFSQTTSAARAKVMSRIGRRSSIEKPATNSQWMPTLKWAAAIFILVAAAWLTKFESDVLLSNHSNDLITFDLPDGSVATLSANSEISYNSLWYGFRRSIELDGAGFFEVRKGKPFSVHGNKGHVEVLGTQFTVWNYDKNFLVHCLSGRVKVESGENTEVLSPGDMARAHRDGISMNRQINLENFVFPQPIPKLRFYVAPLELVLSELSIKLDLELESSLPNGLFYTGVLDTSRPQECLNVIAKTYAAHFEHRADGSMVLSQ